MAPTQFAHRLVGLVGADHVLAEESCVPYAVDGRIPEAVVFPGDAHALSEVMRFAASERLSVAPRGNGTTIGLGGVPERLDLVVGLTRLNRIIHHEPGDLTATFEAGMPLSDAQAALRQSRQFLPLDPDGCERATIGGILATNASGPWRHRYGTARDLVIGIRVVHADGAITKGGAQVVKSVSGYDMNKLYIGSLGTLGMIVEATCRLHPLPAAERTWFAPFPTGEAATRALIQILHSTIVCTRVELLSSVAAQLAGQQIGDRVPADTVAVALSVGSMPEAVDIQIAAIEKHCREAGAATGLLVEGSTQANLWKAICDLPAPSGDGRRWMTLKASVLPTHVLDTIRHADTLSRALGLESAAVSEFGCGIIRFCWSGASDAPEPDPIAVSQAVQELRNQVGRHGGRLVILSAPPAMKALVDVWGPAGGALPLMKELKRQFDPQRLLNPGRFVGGI